MKHLLIVNSHAGHESQEALNSLIEKSFKGLDYEVYTTTGPRSCITFLKEYFTKNTKETTRVYAIGGDGTIHEAVNGIIGFKNAELAILPYGTGNDFVKIYGVFNENLKEYQSFDKLISGTAEPIDISKISGTNLEEPWYSINVINFGFDAIVGAKGNENKLKGIKDPYGFTHAIVPAIAKGRFNKIVVSADGEPINSKKLLLSSIAQGQWVGGEYHASPKSDNTDGLLDIVVFKTMSLSKLLIKLFKKYHDGVYMDEKGLEKSYFYKKAKKASIDAPKDIDVCVDGEMIKGTHFDIECLPGAIKLVKPAK